MENEFCYFDELLEELLFSEMPYEQLTEFCNKLLKYIKTPHQNSIGNIFPSSFVQCVLECYKRKNNFSSSIWHLKKELTDTEIKNSIMPVKFARINAKGELINYIFYNKDQIQKENEIEKQKTSEEIEYKKETDDIKTAIIACISDFNGLYGKSGIAKILKGSQSLKDNSHNKEALNSSHFGLFSSSTLKSIETEIENLITASILKIKKVAFGRPVLFVEEKPKTIISKTKEEIKSEDTNLEKIIKLINNDENIFITGHAGTGKSYILNKLKEKYGKKLTITSTTGIAAVNVKGQTLHSWAGVGICRGSFEKTAEKVLTKRAIKNQIQKCEMLAIDEVSMLDIHTFEYVDRVLRIIRETDAPFGGIQLILIGDFFQLPPVENKEKEQKYCFESELWKELNLKNVILTKSYRQSEENFIKALSDMRTNKLSNSDIELLKTREFSKLAETSDILHIYATNIEADSYNQKMYNNINSKEYNLLAVDVIYKNGKPVQEFDKDDNKILQRIDSICRAEKNISLKIGTRVMLLINLDFEKGLINGSCGTVDEIFDNYISVDFDNGINYKVPKHDFEFYNNEILIAKRQQFPIRLAYGITIHKSQGMSLDKLVVDCSRIFEKGQAYVAFSRIKTLAGLFLYNFDPKKVIVDEKVAKFYEKLETI